MCHELYFIKNKVWNKAVHFLKILSTARGRKNLLDSPLQKEALFIHVVKVRIKPKSQRKRERHPSSGKPRAGRRIQSQPAWQMDV